jgi:serine protease Do
MKWKGQRATKPSRVLSLLGGLAIFTNVAACQSQSLSQREACQKFSDAVVSIDAGGESKGSGFLVSPDGLILTANHVVADKDGTYHQAISVHLSTGEDVLASPAMTISAESVGQDFAILKVSAKSKLPFLSLGSSHHAWQLDKMILPLATL